MWRSKKLIVGAVLVAVMLAGSIGGIALANEGEEESQPEVRCGAFLGNVCEIYEENTGESINCTALKESFAEAHGKMWGEKLDGRLHYAPMTQVFESLGYDQEEVQAAFEVARGELEAGTLEGGRGAVMAMVLEILGITEEDWQAACAEVRQDHQFGFHGMRGMRDWGRQCTPPQNN